MQATTPSPMPDVPDVAAARGGAPAPAAPAALGGESPHLPDSEQHAELGADSGLLVWCLRDHDAPCPACGYNLRGLTRPRCPECRRELSLTVGVAKRPLGWLFAAVAPGFFSGIAACFLLVPIVARLLFGDGLMSGTLNTLALFGGCSGISAIMISRRHGRFLVLSRGQQVGCTILIWIIHFVALVLLIVFGPMFL